MQSDSFKILLHYSLEYILSVWCDIVKLRGQLQQPVSFIFEGNYWRPQSFIFLKYAGAKNPYYILHSYSTDVRSYLES